MKKRQFLKTYFFLIFYLGSFTLSYSQDLLWPTDASYLITSTFCEFRPGHFHAGIDIKTWAASGYKIFAVEDGSVIRIKTSPYGYGRVLYLKLSNGTRAVYAHLADFSPRFKTILIQEQDRLGRYSIDKYFSEGELPVKKGEVLGYTGRSGTKIPHLHFEIRDKNNTPVNPFIAGFRIKDTISPTVTFVAVTPLSERSQVNGDYISQIIPVVSEDNNHYVFADTVFCKGEIGFSISTYDMADGASNKFAPYRMTLFLNDTLVFSTKYDSLSFDQTRQIYLDRDYRLMKLGRGYFHKLYRSPGNTLDFYYFKGKRAGIIDCRDNQLPHNKKITVIDDGSFILSPGVHKIKIIVSDFYNNISVVRGVLCNNDLPVVCRYISDTGILINDTNAYDTASEYFYKEIIRDYLYCSIFNEEILSENPRVRIDMTPWKTFSFLLSRNRTGRYSGLLPLEKDYFGIMTISADIVEDSVNKTVFTDTVMIHSVLKNKSSHLYSMDTVCSVHFPDNCLYQNIKVYCERIEFSHPNCINGYKYNVFPQTVPLRNPVEISFNVALTENNRNKTAIYKVDENGFSFVGKNQKDNCITGWSYELGSYTLLQDTVAPDIDLVRPGLEETITASTPVITVFLKDTLSGLSGEDSYIIRLDGNRQIVEYDPGMDLCYCPVRNPLDPGIHFLEITVKDRMDNINKLEAWFRVADSGKQ